MAQAYYPLHITNPDRTPALLGTGTGAINSFTASGQTNNGFGAASGLVTTGALGRRPVYHAILTATAQPLVISTPTVAHANVDAVLRVRTLNTTATGRSIGLLCRASQHASGAYNGYGVFAMGLTDYRKLTLTTLTGTTTTSFGTPTVTDDFVSVQSSVPAQYQYIRIRANGSAINAYSWWEGDGAPQQAKTSSISSTTYASAGVVAIMIVGVGIYELDFMSYGDDTDTASISVSQRELNGVVYQPGGATPALDFPVRAYHRASGAPVSRTVSSASDGTFRISELRYGAVESVLNAVDANEDSDEWGHAISGPVTPSLG